LSPEEVARLLEAAPGPKYKAALSDAYAAGLRVSEVVAPKVSDIDSERLLLRIEQEPRTSTSSTPFSDQSRTTHRRPLAQTLNPNRIANPPV
jgi:integrase